MKLIGHAAHEKAEAQGRTVCNLHDVLVAFDSMGVNMKDLVEEEDETPFVHVSLSADTYLSVNSCVGCERKIPPCGRLSTRNLWHSSESTLRSSALRIAVRAKLSSPQAPKADGHFPHGRRATLPPAPHSGVPAKVSGGPHRQSDAGLRAGECALHRNATITPHGPAAVGEMGAPLLWLSGD